MTAYYAGKCTGNVVVGASGIIEGLFGTVITVTGGVSIVAEGVSGGGVVLIPGTVAVIL